MVDVIGRAKVVITGDVDSTSIDKAGGRIGSSLKRGAVIGVAALGTLAVAGVKAFQSFEEAEAASRGLTNVLDNMGKSAAAPAVEKLADELRKLTGIDDEVIKGGQTILATFSEVAESAGEVGGTFERATRAAVDLSAAGFGDVSSASKILGKALQDPVKGITALSRAGVTFTEDQKKLIKGFVEANDVASAQALILKEVEKQVSGTAEATATESDKIKTALGELQETFGFFIDDLLSGEGATKSFSERLEDLNDELIELQKSEGWAGIRGAIRGIGHAIGFVVGLLGEWSAFWEEAGGDFRDFVTQLDEGYAAMISGFRDAFRDVVQSVKDAIKAVEKTIPDWGKVGGKILTAFVKGMASGGIPGVLAERIKDAINDALPDEITFFGGKGGVPAITVRLPQLATGTRNFSGGLALVGEQGPEIVNLPPGSDVYSNRESQRMTATGSGDGFTLQQVFNGPTSLAEARREADWARTYGTRFGSATAAGAL